MKPDEISCLEADALLAACARSRDELLWAEFQHRFHSLIAGSVARTIRQYSDLSPDLVGDLTQDTYVKLCRKDCKVMRDFQPHSAPAVFAFLKVVAANVVRDYFKSVNATKRGAAETFGVDQPDNVTSRGAWDPVNALERQILFEQVYDILRAKRSGTGRTRFGNF